VRTREVHGGDEQGALPSTQPVWSETKVTEAAAKSTGTGPPAGPGGAAVVEALVAVVVETPVVTGPDLVDAGLFALLPHAARLTARSITQAVALGTDE